MAGVGDHHMPRQLAQGQRRRSGMARWGHRVGATGHQQHRALCRRQGVERWRHHSARPSGAGLLVEPGKAVAEVSALACAGRVCLPGRSDRRGSLWLVFGANDREVHAAGNAAAHAERAAQSHQGRDAALRRCGHRLRQRSGQGRGVERAAHQAEQGVAAQAQALRLARQWVTDLDLARQTGQQLAPLLAQVWVARAAGWRALTVVKHRVQRRLVVGRHGARQRQPGRHHAVQHAAAHMLRIRALVGQGGAGAVREADQVDALGAQRAAHRVDVGHRDVGGELAQVALRQHLQRAQAGLQARLALAVVGQGLPRGGLGVVGTTQWCAAASAALVDEHQVAPVAQPGETRGQGAGQVDRALAGAASEEKHWVRQRVARQRRHHRHLHLDLLALGLRRVQRTANGAAACSVGVAAQPAGLQGQRAGFARRDRRRQSRPCGQHGHRNHPGQPQQRYPWAHHQPSILRNSPLAISRARSFAPPTNWPLTKTIGRVGQPLHIFSARRRRHWLK